MILYLFSRPTAKKPVAKPNIVQILPTPKELSLQSSEIANERYKWEKYR